MTYPSPDTVINLSQSNENCKPVTISKHGYKYIKLLYEGKKLLTTFLV